MMEAYAIISKEGDDNITERYFGYILSDMGIKAGIQNSVIHYMVENELYDTRMIIAKGEPAGITQKGYYDFFFDATTSSKAPTIREDGSLDYAQHHVMAKAGEKIGIYHPPHTGRFGFTVYAAMISPKIVKEKKIVVGKGVEEVDEVLYATEDGEIKLTESKIMIENQITISGNAKYGMDTTDFVGNVHVMGDVHTGVKIKAGGDIVVEGIVEGATLIAGKDVIIRGGVHGQGGAIIQADGDVVAKFINDAKVTAKGSIKINYAMNAELKAAINITAAGNRSRIIGGRATAGVAVSADVLGNAAEISTVVEVVTEANPSLPNYMIRVGKECNPNVEILVNGISYIYGEQKAGEYHLADNVLGRYDFGTYLPKMEPVYEKEKPLIMLIDDEPMIIKTFYSFLQADYRVMMATNPRDVLPQLENTIPDLILLDYQMPVMDGGKLLELIRSLTDKPYCHVPVMFVTAMTDKDIVQKCLSLYPQGYLTKPLSKDELLGVIDILFNSYSINDRKLITKG